MQVVATELEGPVELSGIVTREDDDGGILRRARGKNKVSGEEDEQGEDEANGDKLEEDDGLEVDLDISEEE